MIVPVALLAGALAVAAPTAFDQVIDAIAAGQHPGGRYRAAQLLTDTGAHPLDGDDDLAQAWHGPHPAAPYRDRALGPGYRRIVVRSGGVAHFGQVFLAGQRARVALVPVSAANVHLSVTDGDGAAQCRGARPDRCDWVPLWTTRFEIELSNTGPATADYYVIVE